MVAGIGLTLSCMKKESPGRRALDRAAGLSFEIGRNSALLFQEREAGLRVFPNLVAVGNQLDGLRAGDAGEVVDGDFLAAFEFLPAMMKVVGPAGLLAGNGVC